MSRAELNLLLYVETRAVDHCGRLDFVHLNEDDFEILRGWTASGYVESGRIASDFGGGTWVRLSEKAWTDVAAERKTRADRLWKGKQFLTTAEKRAQ